MKNQTREFLPGRLCWFCFRCSLRTPRVCCRCCYGNDNMKMWLRIAWHLCSAVINWNLKNINLKDVLRVLMI